MFNVIDKQTGKPVNRRPYASRIAANRRADKLDAQYGAYRYYSRPVAPESRPVS